MKYLQECGSRAIYSIGTRKQEFAWPRACLLHANRADVDILADALHALQTQVHFSWICKWNSFPHNSAIAIQPAIINIIIMINF